jgi:hypothetical protein
LIKVQEEDVVQTCVSPVMSLCSYRLENPTLEEALRVIESFRTVLLMTDHELQLLKHTSRDYAQQQQLKEQQFEVSL